MPINNINTLQNFEDLKYTSELAKQSYTGVLDTDYYIHALANLEQRNEYRYSNGIKYGIIRYDKKIIIGSNDILSNDSIAETTTLLELANDMSFDIYVNNIETYLKHSQIYNDGEIFKSLLFGKILGTDNTPETNDVEIQYNEIDLKNHTLNEAYRVFYLDDTTNNNIYILIHLKKNDQSDKLVNEYTYTLTVYKLVFRQENTTVRNLFKSLTYESSNKIGTIFDNVELDVRSTALFEEFIKSGVYSTETIENNYTLTCTYDTVDEQYIKISEESMLSDNYNKINELLYFNYYNISQYIRAINNDITVTYPNILKYYSNRQFNSNNDTLKMMIARSLYTKIYNELENDYQRKNAQLVIPEETTITYVSNVENALQLYYTDNIYVYFINNSNNNKQANANIKGIQFYYGGIDKTILYNIYSKYNTKYTDLVDSFIVNKKYVLPYIDDSHLWNINDNQTTIYASGESAGNPNIFIIRTMYDETKNPSIYGVQLNRTDIQQNLLSYEIRTVQIAYDNKGTEKTEQYKYVFAVPKINAKSIDKLKYATLFIVSNIVTYGEGNDATYVDNAPLITSIWTINDISDEDARFKYITVDGTSDGQPMTIDDMFGLDGAIYRKFAEYGHVSNIFDDLIALKLPKTIINGSETKKQNYFVIERNTYIDNLSPDKFDEDAYNFNLVEMKIANTLATPDFSYAYVTSSQYTDTNKLLNTWYDNKNITNTDNVKQIYYTGSIDIYTDDLNDVIGRNATTNDLENTSTLSQSIASPNTLDPESEHNATTQVVGSFDIELLDKYTGLDFDKNSLPEYLPKSYVPILRESNLLHQDHNIISRSNIYSFTGDSHIYYSYIGTSCVDNDKNILHIGTSDFSYMINLGKEALVSPSVEKSADIFKQTKKLSIDLSYTEIKSQETLIHNLNTKNSVRTNIYENNNESTKITTIELYHIVNNYDSHQLVTMIKTKHQNDNTDDYVYEYKDINTINEDCRFTAITMDNSTGEFLNKPFCKYLKTYYQDLFTNEYIGNIGELFIYNRENNNVLENDSNSVAPNLTIGGIFLKNQKILLLDTPLIIHIVTNSNTTKIYI